jgi:hypothetical protein
VSVLSYTHRTLSGLSNRRNVSALISPHELNRVYLAVLLRSFQVVSDISYNPDMVMRSSHITLRFCPDQIGKFPKVG